MSKTLHRHLWRLKGQEKAAGDAREQLVEHARAKLEDVQRAVEGWEKQLSPEDEGNVLQFRRYKTLLAERQRLQRILSDHDARRRAQSRGPSII